MATEVQLKLTPTKPKGALVKFAINGWKTDFTDGKAITTKATQDKCYTVMLTCDGKLGDKASVAFSAATKGYAVYVCTPSGGLTWTECKSVEVKVGAPGSATEITKIALRLKPETKK